MFELLKKLSDAHGMSGFEGSIADIVKEELKGFDIKEDSNGNVIVTKGGHKAPIMLAAHMDEIGMMVKRVNEDGKLEFECVGGFYAPTLLNQRVVVHGEEGHVVGVVGGKPPHVMTEEERKAPISAKTLRIYVGTDSREETLKLGIDVGTPITMDMELKRMAGSKVTGKALDNRAGCCMLIEAMKRMKTDKKVVAVFTVQEEVGLRGARYSAFKVEPRVGIATDVSIAGEGDIEFGKGTVVNIADHGLISNPKVIKKIKEVAKEKELKVQFAAFEGGTTDAAAIGASRGGVPSVVCSTPAMFIHSPVEVIDLEDLEAGVGLICEVIDKL